MSIVDASDSTVSPGSATTSSSTPVVPATDTVGSQVQPRVMARQIPSSTARGQMQLGATNIYTDSPGQRIIVQDNSNVPVVSIGNIGTDSTGNTEWGMKVAQAGVDVTTATNSQLIFNSAQDILKVVETDLISVTVAATSSAVDYSLQHFESTLRHNLGFNPLVIATFVSTTSSGYASIITGGGVTFPITNWSAFSGIAVGNPVTTTVTLPLANFNAYISSVTSTTVVFSIDASSAVFNGDYVIKYYLLQETAAPSPSDTHGSVL